MTCWWLSIAPVHIIVGPVALFGSWAKKSAAVTHAAERLLHLPVPFLAAHGAPSICQAIIGKFVEVVHGGGRIYIPRLASQDVDITGVVGSDVGRPSTETTQDVQSVPDARLVRSNDLWPATGAQVPPLARLFQRHQSVQLPHSLRIRKQGGAGDPLVAKS